jgi:hypothetical protein
LTAALDPDGILVQQHNGTLHSRLSRTSSASTCHE